MMVKFRIAVVQSVYDRSQPSGENNAVDDQVAVLRDAGHEVLLVARETDIEKTKPLFAARSALRVASGRGSSPTEMLRAYNPDIVHMHNTFPNWSTQWAEDWSSRLVVTLHNVRPFCSAGTFFRDGHACTDCLITPVWPALKHKCYTKSRLRTAPLAIASRPSGALKWPIVQASAVVCLNDRVRTLVRPLTAAEVEVIPNFSNPTTKTVQCRERSGWVYAGRFSTEKGIEWLLDNWPPGEPLTIIGSGPFQERVRQWSSSRPHVELLGSQSREAVLERLGESRGVVIPSLCQEGFPTVALEGLAMGTPLLVSSKVAAAQSLAKQGVAAEFDPEMGMDGLKAAMRWVAVGAQRDLSSHCLAVFESSYSRQTWLRRMESVYHAVVRR